MAKIHIIAAFAIILLSAFVQAQWPWGGNNNDDDDDEPAQSPWAWNSQPAPRPTSSPRGWGPQPTSPRPQDPWQQPWSSPRPSPRPTQQPQQPPWSQEPPRQSSPRPKQPQQSPWGPGPQNPGQPQPRPVVTVTVTRPKNSNQPTQQNPQPTQAPWPTVQPQQPQQQPPRSKTWTQPSAWGPPRSPFGPNPTQTGPQTIPTTTTEKPKEPVPFLTTCGRTKYIEDDVQNAIITGCYYKNKTTTVNKSEFPRRFSNTQNFNFGDVRPPYWEFPLINSAGFVGGPPGPDRVIFNEACFLAGEITTTNAGARGYTECIEAF